MTDDRAPARRPRRATIDDVARAAAVSRQTVSNVVHNRGRLGEETRQRVRSAIDALGYTPSHGARSLRSGLTLQLAHPAPPVELEPGNAIAVAFIQALVAAAGRRGRHVLLTASHDATADVDGLMRRGQVDGFLFSTLQTPDPRVEAVVARGYPFACFGRTEPHLPQCWVDVDNGSGVEAAVRLLVARGHRRIAYVGYPGATYWDRERIDGFHRATTRAGLGPQRALTVVDPRFADAVDDLIAGTDPPTAVVTGSDVLAEAVYRRAQRLGLVIGRDLAVTGFDGSLVGRALAPRLTTVVVPVTRIAELVVDRVLRELDGPTGEPGVVLPLSVDVGQSTG